MVITHRSDVLNAASLARLPLLSRLAYDFAFLMAKWQMRSVTRRNLEKLDSHLLQDIGLQPGDAHRERTNRFWQD